MRSFPDQFGKPHTCPALFAKGFGSEEVAEVVVFAKLIASCRF